MREWLGYAWVRLADDPAGFTETVIGAVTARFGDEHDIEAWAVDSLIAGRRITYDVRANWKLIVENVMECYPRATIHPELTEVLPEFADGYAAQYYVGHDAEFGAGVQGFTVDDRTGGTLVPSPGMADNGTDTGTADQEPWWTVSAENWTCAPTVELLPEDWS